MCRDVTLFHSRIEPRAVAHRVPCRFLPLRPSDERAAQPIDAVSDVSRPPILVGRKFRSEVGDLFQSIPATDPDRTSVWRSSHCPAIFVFLKLAAGRDEDSDF
jgi:hypothetical protein